jgi:hypothetical protein
VLPVIGVFDVRDGPRIVEAPSIVSDPDRFALLLFPAQWADKHFFVFEWEKKFVLVLCCIAPLMTHSRGLLNVSIGLMADTMCFSLVHTGVLADCARLLGTMERIEPNSMVTLIKNVPAAAIQHPLVVFTSASPVAKIFSGKMAHLLTIWRCRVLGLSILITLSNDVQLSTCLSYFIGAMGLPIRDMDECAFHYDMNDTDKFRAMKWKVCGVTHAMMQKEQLGHMDVGPEGKIFLRKGLKWLLEGRGEVMRQFKGLLRAGRDEALLCEFFRLNHMLLDITRGRRVSLKNEMANMGLDDGNMKFLHFFLESRGIRVGEEVGGGCCGCCA